MSQPPAIDFAVLPGYLTQEEYLREVLTQLEKDFQTSGLAFTIPSPLPGSFEALLDWFEQELGQLLSRSPESLAQLLYRIDITPAQIRKYTAELPGKTYTQQLGAVLLLRELQKIVLRKFYRG